MERITALRQEFPMEEFIGYFNQGGLVDHATVRRSMELFAREVIPQCRERSPDTGRHTARDTPSAGQERKG